MAHSQKKNFTINWNRISKSGELDKCVCFVRTIALNCFREDVIEWSSGMHFVSSRGEPIAQNKHLKINKVTHQKRWLLLRPLEYKWNTYDILLKRYFVCVCAYACISLYVGEYKAHLIRYLFQAFVCVLYYMICGLSSLLNLQLGWCVPVLFCFVFAFRFFKRTLDSYAGHNRSRNVCPPHQNLSVRLAEFLSSP